MVALRHLWAERNDDCVFLIKTEKKNLTNILYTVHRYNVPATVAGKYVCLCDASAVERLGICLTIDPVAMCIWRFLSHIVHWTHHVPNSWCSTIGRLLSKRFAQYDRILWPDHWADSPIVEHTIDCRFAA